MFRLSASQDLVLYGLDDKAKPRAALVAAAEADAARVIAAGLNFQLRPISTGGVDKISAAASIDFGVLRMTGLLQSHTCGARNGPARILTRG